MAVRKIEKTAKTVYDARNELRSLKKSFTNELNLTENWWQGEAQKHSIMSLEILIHK